MAEEIKKVISIDTNGADSVKDLIDKVEKLRGILKTLDETSDEYKTTLSELKKAQDSLSSSLGQNKTKAEAAEGSYNALAQQMKVLKKEWKATNDEAERNALGKEIKGINDQLKTLDQSIGNNQRNVGNYAGSFQALRQEIKDARDVMAGAARGSDEYAEAAKRAAEASDKLRDMQKEIVNGASGLDNKFSVISNTMGSIAGGFAAAQGAMALFGAESENLQKTFVKLQAAMSMTQGLKALAELPKGLNAAKIAFGGVTTGVKNFIKGLNGVKGAIAATGIGILLVLLGELIANWDAVTEAVGNFVGGMDGLTEKLAGVANVIKNFITGPIKALSLAFNGQFSEALDAFKDGFKISANYAVGVQNQMVKNNQKAEQKKREEYGKTKDDYIKDMEAQYGADWKYTKDGQKAYREYYNNKLKMYKKDSEEYKKAQRDMWTYERELREQASKGSDKSGGSSKSGKSGGSKAKAGKSEADKAAEELEKESERLNDFLEDLRKKRRTAREEAQEEYDNALKDLKRSLELRKITLEQFNDNVAYITKERDKKFKKADDELKEDAEKTAVEYVQSLKNKFELELDKFRGELVGNMFPTNEEVQLAIKKLDVEDGPFSKYLLKGKDGVEEFLTDVEQKIQDLEKMNYEYSMVDLLLGGGAGAKGKGAIEFFDLIDDVNEAIDFLQNDKMVDFWQKMDEIASDGVEEQKAIVEKSINTVKGWTSDIFSWRFQKGSEVVEGQIESNNRELASFIAVKEKELEAIREQLTAEGLGEDERIKLAQEAEQIKREEIEKTAETERKNSEITLNVIRQVEEGKKTLISKTMEALGNSGQFLMNWSDNIVKKETKNGQKMSKEKEKQAETMFNVGKALAISEAVVSTYQGAQESYTSLASIPYVGPALGIAAAAAAVTAGMLRIQSITSQKFGDQGNVSDAGSSVGITSAVAVPQLEQTPYSYTSTVTNAQDEDELNKPTVVLISDVEDAMKVRESRQVETSF